MRSKILLFVALTFMVSPLVAAELESAEGPALPPTVEETDLALAAPVQLEPVSLRELIDNFLILEARGFEDCGQTGACNNDRDCRWMQNQCPLGTFPVCEFGTGSGCQGECACGW